MDKEKSRDKKIEERKRAEVTDRAKGIHLAFNIRRIYRRNHRKLQANQKEVKKMYPDSKFLYIYMKINQTFPEI